MRFLHTADWQLGMTRHYLNGDAQPRYSAARRAAVAALGPLAAVYVLLTAILVPVRTRFDAQIAPARAELAAREGALQHVRPANVVVLHPAALADRAGTSSVQRRQ